MTIRFKDDIKEVFVGHTQTATWDLGVPIIADKLVMIDTGAGFKGRLTLMDVETKDFWQSDKLSRLYTNETAR